MRKQLSPMSALWRGLLAGAAGAGIQSLFFRATARFTPETPKDVFEPPEPEQSTEMPTQTVARRMAALAGRGPLSEEQKVRGSQIVHYGYGATWGAAYGVLRESLPALRRPAGVVGYASAVWMVADNIILPLFRLAAWPQRYPAKLHVYAWMAHLAYGAGVAAAYEALRKTSLVSTAIGAWLLWRRARALRRIPAPLRPAAKTVLNGAARPLRRAGGWATTALRP
jgi:uncharacterized membrane protein YagU involved in acid resistance